MVMNSRFSKAIVRTWDRWRSLRALITSHQADLAKRPSFGRSPPANRPISFEDIRSPWEVTFSPDGQTMASSGGEQTVFLWSTNDWQIKRRFEFDAEPRYPRSIAFTPDWKTMAVGSAYQVQLWSVERVEKLAEANIKVKGVYALTSSPNGRWLANAAADKKVRVRELPPTA